MVVYAPPIALSYNLHLRSLRVCEPGFTCLKTNLLIKENNTLLFFGKYLLFLMTRRTTPFTTKVHSLMTAALQKWVLC